MANPNWARTGAVAGLLVSLAVPAWGQSVDAVTVEAGLLSWHSFAGNRDTERTFGGFGGVMLEADRGLAINVAGVYIGEAGLVAQLKGGWRIGPVNWFRKRLEDPGWESSLHSRAMTGILQLGTRGGRLWRGRPFASRVGKCPTPRTP